MSDQSTKPFRFKQFEVLQSRSAMRVGTDSVLLGAWADVNLAKSILDVGTGTGVIALLCAQRNASAKIDAIEIDEGSAEDAFENFGNSPWSGNLRLHRGDYLKIVSDRKFDLVISNPPYFSQSLRSTDPVRNAARHDDRLPAEAFMIKTKEILQRDGIIALIFPKNQLDRWTSAALNMGFYVQRICHVFTLANKDSYLVMAEFAAQHTSESKVETLVIENQPGEYTAMYKELTKPYYTKW
jgi:tRNA1Val (adenine37-N6)-methyltransferase